MIGENIRSMILDLTAHRDLIDEAIQSLSAVEGDGRVGVKEITKTAPPGFLRELVVSFLSGKNEPVKIGKIKKGILSSYTYGDLSAPMISALIANDSDFVRAKDGIILTVATPKPEVDGDKGKGKEKKGKRGKKDESKDDKKTDVKDKDGKDIGNDDLPL